MRLHWSVGLPGPLRVGGPVGHPDGGGCAPIVVGGLVGVGLVVMAASVPAGLGLWAAAAFLTFCTHYTHHRRRGGGET